MTMITPSYLGETIEYSSLHACRSTLEDPTCSLSPLRFTNGSTARECGGGLKAVAGATSAPRFDSTSRLVAR